MIVELAGLPRSGKTSAIEVARDFFARSGRNVRTVTEGARSCPFDRQHRIELACWTANQALNNVLETKLAGPQQSLVLQDRGLFDAIAFLKLLHIENRIDVESFTHFAGYFTNQRWTGKVDLVILLSVEPSAAISRDLAAKLSNNPALVTNIASLNALEEAYEFVLQNYGGGFPRLRRIDTTFLDRMETVHMVISEIQELGFG